LKKRKSVLIGTKLRVTLEDGIELSTNCRQLKLVASDGKKYKSASGLFKNQLFNYFSKFPFFVVSLHTIKKISKQSVYEGN